MHTLTLWAAAAVAAIALGGVGSPAAADAPGPNYEASPHYVPAQPAYPYQRPPVVYGHPAPPPPVVHYDAAPPPVVVYPRRYRYSYGPYGYGGGARFYGPRYAGPRHFGPYARGYGFHGRHGHR